MTKLCAPPGAPRSQPRQPSSGSGAGGAVKLRRPAEKSRAMVAPSASKDAAPPVRVANVKRQHRTPVAAIRTCARRRRLRQRCEAAS